MRLDHLHLQRFGCFTDEAIDFGSAGEGPDFHVIYGDNEAGKSTLRDAISDFLYGVEERTRYNFLHDNRALAIGASLTTADGPFSAIRVKGRRGTLKDKTGGSADEAALLRLLTGINREEFLRLFSLDRDQLVRGGDDILRAEGSLGALLFAGASGLTSASATLDEIADEADAIFRPRAQSTKIAEAAKAIDAIKQRHGEIDIDAPTFRRLVEAEQEAADRYDAAKAAYDERQAAMTEMKSNLAAVGPWRDIEESKQRLAALGATPRASIEDLDRARELQTAQIETASQVKSAEEDIHRLEAELNEATIPAYADDLLQGMAALGVEELESRARTAFLDISKRQAEHAAAQNKISATLRKIGEEEDSDPSSLVLAAPKLIQLKDLARRGEQIFGAYETANSEAMSADEAEREAEAGVALHKLPPDARILEAAIEAERSYLDLTRLEEERERCRQSDRALMAALQGLRPWVGDVDALGALLVPSREKLSGLVKDLDKVANEIAHFQSRLDEIARAIDEHRSFLAAWEADPDIVSDDAARSLRDRRDEAWLAHREALSEKATGRLDATADAYEATRTEFDQASEKRALRGADLGQMREWSRLLKTNEGEERRCTEQLTALRAEQTKLSEASAFLAEDLGLPTTTSLPELETWLSKRQGVLALAAEAKDHTETLRQRETLFTEAASRLRRIADESGCTLPDDDRHLLDLAIRHAKTLTENEAARQAAKDRMEEARRAAKKRAVDRETAKAALDDWRTEWDDALVEVWFDHTEPGAVLSLLEGLQELAPQIDAAHELGRRIDAMRSDIEAFTDIVRRLTSLAGDSQADDPPLEIAAALKSEAEQICVLINKRETVSERLAQSHERLREAKRQAGTVDQEIGALGARTGAKDLQDTIEHLERAREAASIEKAIDGHRRTLRDVLNSDDEGQWRARLAPLVASDEALATAKADLAAAEREAELEFAALQELHTEKKTAAMKTQAVKGDETAAALEQERSTLLETMAEHAQTYLELRAGKMIVERAMHAYRDAHRGTMMEAASAAFSQMTAGRYPRLVAVPTGDDETLVAERADDGTIAVDRLSEGTRTQLYLALRIAGHAEFSRTRPPLPFIADDILEPFDDQRALATFRLLHDMSRKGQVIYLTHHRHLIEIAEQASGSAVRVHELRPASARAASRESAE